MKKTLKYYGVSYVLPSKDICIKPVNSNIKPITSDLTRTKLARVRQAISMIN